MLIIRRLNCIDAASGIVTHSKWPSGAQVEREQVYNRFGGACVHMWYNAPTMLPAGGRQHHGCIIPQTVTHSLVLLKMGKIISRNMLS